MAFTKQSHTTAAATSQAASLSINKPSGTVEGDLLTMSVGVTQGSSLPPTVTVSGWTQMHITSYTAAQVGIDVSIIVLAKVAGASEPASYSIVPNSNARISAVATRFDGEQPDTSGWPDDSGGSSAGSLTAPDATASGDNSLVLRSYSSHSTGTWGGPSGHTLIANVSNPGWLEHRHAFKTQASAGAVGTAAATRGGSGHHGAVTVVFASVQESTLTDSALASTNVLGTDVLSQFQTLTDPSLIAANSLFLDTLGQVLGLSDTSLLSGNVLTLDQIKRIVHDQLLVGVPVLFTDGFQGLIDVQPYWVWRMVRQDGGLFLTPVRSRRAWTGADVVSDDFRFTTRWSDYANAAVLSAWTTHKASDTATLKAAINAALSGAGFLGTDGELL